MPDAPSLPSPAAAIPVESATPAKALPHSRLRGPFDIRSFALTGLFFLAVVYTMYFTRAILLPIILALLLSQLLAPVVRTLAKWRIPQMVGSALVLLVLCGAFLYAVSFLTGPAKSWIDRAPQGLHELQAKLIPILKRPMLKMKEASGEMEKITTPPGADKPSVVEVQSSYLPGFLLDQTPDFVASSLMLLILLYFLLGYKGVFLNKLVKVIPRLRDKKTAVTIASDIETKISAYLITITLINFGLGCCIAISTYFLGLPNPLLWGTCAMVLNFIPYLGAFCGILAMTVAALLSFNSVGYALLLPGVYVALTTVEGNLITPMLLGRSLTLNPVAILISLMFWGWMWGIVGIVLAVPLLATIKIFCDHIEPLAPLGEFLNE